MWGVSYLVGVCVCACVCVCMCVCSSWSPHLLNQPSLRSIPDTSKLNLPHFLCAFRVPGAGSHGGIYQLTTWYLKFHLPHLYLLLDSEQRGKCLEIKRLRLYQRRGQHLGGWMSTVGWGRGEQGNGDYSFNLYDCGHHCKSQYLQVTTHY